MCNFFSLSVSEIGKNKRRRVQPAASHRGWAAARLEDEPRHAARGRPLYRAPGAEGAAAEPSPGDGGDVAARGGTGQAPHLQAVARRVR